MGGLPEGGCCQIATLPRRPPKDSNPLYSLNTKPRPFCVCPLVRTSRTFRYFWPGCHSCPNSQLIALCFMGTNRRHSRYGGYVRHAPSPVILKIKWRRILKIIWRMQPSRMGPSLGVSATFDQICYLDNASARSVTGGLEFVDGHSASFQSGSIPYAPREIT
jgi:hypothetical protein